MSCLLYCTRDTYLVMESAEEVGELLNGAGPPSQRGYAPGFVHFTGRGDGQVITLAVAHIICVQERSDPSA